VRGIGRKAENVMCFLPAAFSKGGGPVRREGGEVQTEMSWPDQIMSRGMSSDELNAVLHTGCLGCASTWHMLKKKRHSISGDVRGGILC
jgi:hypothetical protein